MFWIAISCICVWSGGLGHHDLIITGPLHQMSYADFVTDPYCKFVAEVSTSMPEPKEGTQVYGVYAISKATQTLVREMEARHREAEERERRSNPRYYDDVIDPFKVQTTSYSEVISIDGWHCVDWRPEYPPIHTFAPCVREEGYGSDGLVHWRRP